MKNLQWQPIVMTAEEKQKHFDLAQSADPAERLFSNYYPTTKRLLIQDYYKLCEGKEPDEIFDEQKDLDEMLATLRQQYETDLNTWLQICMALMGAAVPHHYKVIAAE